MLRVSRMPLFPLIVARERMSRAERPREPEPMVMDEVDAVQEYDAADEAVQLPIHHFNARAISRLLPEGGTLIPCSPWGGSSSDARTSRTGWSSATATSPARRRSPGSRGRRQL